MKKENAILYFEQGRNMLRSERLTEALELFSKAIALDPHYVEAYRNRGEVFARLGRANEADADMQQVKSFRSGSPNSSKKAGTRTIQKIDLHSIENVYEDLTLNADDEFDSDDDLFGYAFSDETLEPVDLLDEPATQPTKQTGFQAILEYLNGKREEVSSALLFEPTEDELTLVPDGQTRPVIISLEQLSCIRLARVPPGFARNKDENCHVEIVETFDGNIFYEYIHPAQNRKNILYGFSTNKDTRFKYTLIPYINIKKRFQRRNLGQILLEKKLITSEALQHVLTEHNELKKVKFGRLLAEHAKILYSAVETEIQRAYENPDQKLKVGEILINAGLVSEEQIHQTLAHQKRLHNRKLGNFLIEKGILQEQEVCMALAEKFRLPFVDLRQQKGSKKALSLLPREIIEKLNVLPLSFDQGILILATLLPDPSTICEVILKHTPAKEIKFVMAQPSHLKKVIKVIFQKQ